MAKRLAIAVELVGITTGLWCQTCALSTGVMATVSTGFGLTSRRRCAECGGTAVSVDD